MSISYGKAIDHFSKSAYPPRVREIIEQFRKLKERGVLRDHERDISVWLKRGFSELVRFVEIANFRVTKREAKRALKSDAIKLIDTPTVKFVIPLSIEAAKLYGKGTVWCTTSREAGRNRFINFFYCNKATSVVLYWINTETDARIGILYQVFSNGPQIHYYDGFNRSMTAVEFEEHTGIAEADIISHVEHHSEAIDFARCMPVAVQEDIAVDIGECFVCELAESVKHYSLVVDNFITRVYILRNERVSEFQSGLDGVKHDYQVIGGTIRSMVTSSTLSQFRNLTVAQPIMQDIVESSEAYSKLKFMETQLEAVNEEVEVLDELSRRLSSSYDSSSLMDRITAYSSRVSSRSYITRVGNRGEDSILTTAVQQARIVVPTVALNPEYSATYVHLVQMARQSINETISRLMLDTMLPTASAEAVGRNMVVYRPPQENGP